MTDEKQETGEEQKDIPTNYSPEVVRLYLLNTNYCGPIVYGNTAIDEAADYLKRIHNTYESLMSYVPLGTDGAEDMVTKAKAGFLTEIDDFNSRSALSYLFDVSREANRLIDTGELSAEGIDNILGFMKVVDEVFNILPDNVDDKLELR